MSTDEFKTLLPEVIAALGESPGLVLTAPAGAGKTTMVPPALYHAGFAEEGEILILEPRRLAARLASRWVAAGFGEKPGGTVGYSIRFETVAGERTRIRFLTEGILSRRIVHDPLLAGVSIVILDEFHERHLTTDLALSFLRRLQTGRRPDLKILVMSATLDSGPVAEFLGGAPVLAGAGSPYETVIEYEHRPDMRALEAKVASAVRRLLEEGLDGDVLVFLPGAAEIRRSASALETLAEHADLLVVPLHGDLPGAAQTRAVEPARRRKIILSTNVAETSITIPGIAAVIDSGLARVAGHSPWTGFSTLTLAKISRSSAAQRAGRAGRTRSGRVLRLYTRHDLLTRPERDVPEIHRVDLSESLLVLHGAGIRDARAFGWFERPHEAALDAGEDLLRSLGAVDAQGRLSETGARMLDFPVHPRLARLIEEGERLGAAEECVEAAALLAERDIRNEARTGFGGRRRERPVTRVGPSDLTELADRFEEARNAGFDEDRLSAMGIDAKAARAVERARRQLARRAGKKRSAAASADSEESVRIAVLAAFPDRVARRRSRGSAEFLLTAGGTARLSPGSVVQTAGLIAAVDAGERSGRKGTLDSAGVQIRLASAVEPEWLAGLFPDAITESVDLFWNEKAARVEERRRTFYRQLTLEEYVRPAPPSAETSRLLADAVAARGPQVFHDGDNVAALEVRIALVARSFPDAGFEELEEARIASAMEAACAGRRSFAELARVSLAEVLLEPFGPDRRAMLEREAPLRITLPRGRRVKVHYEKARDPWIASRLQDFFGMKATPAICSGRVPLTVHLLAPNMRPVQVTKDLAGFWDRHYPDLRRQLQRRYPKHAWPDPAEAKRR